MELSNQHQSLVIMFMVDDMHKSIDMYRYIYIYVTYVPLLRLVRTNGTNQIAHIIGGNVDSVIGPLDGPSQLNLIQMNGQGSRFGFSTFIALVTMTGTSQVPRPSSSWISHHFPQGKGLASATNHSAHCGNCIAH